MREQHNGVVTVASVVVLVAAAACTTNSAPAPQSNTVSTTSAAPLVAHAPPLDGTYRQDIDEAGVTTDGLADPSRIDKDPTWFGFRSACTTMGCVAIGTNIDPRKLGLPQPQSAKGLVWYWINDHWQYSDTYEVDCSGPDGDAKDHISNVWQLIPQPDGFFRGTETITTLSDECDDESWVRVKPSLSPVPDRLPPARTLRQLHRLASPRPTTLPAAFAPEP